MIYWNSPRLLLLISCWWLLPPLTQARPALSELESRRTEIQTQLLSLSYPSLNTGVSPIGYRSNQKESTHQGDQVTIHLAQPALVDLIVLVPPIWRARNDHFEADAFPQSLRILGKDATSLQPTVLKEISDTSPLLPRIAPIIIPIDPPQLLSEVTIEATQLSRRAINKGYVFQLAEVFVFSGHQNLALHQKVTVPEQIDHTTGWSENYLVDGILPYLMDSSRGESSLAYVSTPHLKITPTLQIDLGEDVTIDSLRLHAVDQGDTLPQTYAGDFGLPRHFILEFSSDGSFLKPQIILDTRIKYSGPIHLWNIRPQRVRHLRLRVLTPYSQTVPPLSNRFGLAELELFSKGRNVLLGKTMQSNIPSAAPILTPLLLTDGRNFYGDILPTRQWMQELALRHKLENELAQLETTLAQRYQSQKKTLTRVLWSFALAFITFILSLLYARFRQTRNETIIRERIASNLHDELGANLHAIGLLGKLVNQSADKPKRLETITHRIHKLTQETGNAARDCAHMLRNKNLHDDLFFEMKRHAERLLCDLNHDFKIQEESLLKKLPRRTRIDLHLFLKEALTNIIRHSHAKKVNIHLKLHRHWGRIHLTLDLKDDGIGIQSLPPSLAQRAKLLRATLTSLPPQESGTHLRLNFKRFSLT